MPAESSSVALCPPAWRMALVVCHDPGGPRRGGEPAAPPAWEWFPVVAVRSERSPDSFMRGITASEDFLIWDHSEDQLDSARNLIRRHRDSCRIVVCTWPPADDEERFLKVAQDLSARPRSPDPGPDPEPAP